MHFTPKHCSWMNQIEQWFSILRRRRLKVQNFANLEDLATKIAAFITEWNEIAHPFAWCRKSFQKVLGKVDADLKRAA
jgi:transposase